MGKKEINSDQLNKYIYSYGGCIKAQSVAPYQIVQDLIKYIAPPDDGSSRQIEQGGRQWNHIRPEKIKDTFLCLGSWIVRSINDKFPERPLRISGSLLSMELSLRRFQADDIDYYNPAQKEPRADKLWNKVKYSFQDIHKVGKQYMMKKLILEEYLIMNNKLPDALKLAADKLEETTYRRWYMVFKANTIDKKLVRKFFASM